MAPSLLVVAVAGSCGLWALDRWVLRLDVLTHFRGLRPVSPLYAFWYPIARPQALLFLGLGVGLVVLAPRVCDPGRTSRRIFLSLLTAAAVALPLALFVAREDPAMLGSSFLVYPGEEFYDDALLIPRFVDFQGRQGVSVFLRHYVEAMPRLSLHGQHFPPLQALWLYGVTQLAGRSVLVAGLSVLAAFVGAILLSFLALRRLLSEHAARQAGLVLLAIPSMLDFACTSMDAVFLMWATLAWYLALLALSPEARPVRALVAGLAFAVAALSSFSALPVGFAVLLYASVAAAKKRLSWGHAGTRLLLVGAGFGLGLVTVWLGTGFSWWDCLATARQANTALMTRILGVHPHARWLAVSWGNATGFALGSGVAVVAALLGRLRSVGRRAGEPWAPAALLGLGVMCMGGIYNMEVERIWLFAYPWLAAIALAPGAWMPASFRTVLGVGLAQALAMEITLFTLW